MKYFIQIILFFLTSICYSQSVNGTSGLINIPSARMLSDEKLVIGMSFIPKPYFQRFNKNDNSGINTYLTYAILPFVEIMFRYTHELNKPVTPPSASERGYFPDRMGSIRIRLLNENSKIPALVFGLQDPTALFFNTCLSCTNYSTTYFVLNKDIKNNFINMDLTIGYAFPFFALQPKNIDGIFGGISLKPKNFEKLGLLIEKYSKTINVGLKFETFKKANLMIGFWDLKKMTFSINYFLN